MARTRNNKPSFCKNEVLAELHPLARLLFKHLPCLADREGRLEDRPMRIKAEILPYDDCDVDAFLDDLANSREQFIQRYEVEGERFIQITNFGKHEHPHVNEKPAGFPPPPSGVQCKHGTCTVQEPGEDNANTPFFLLPSSEYLPPSSSAPSSGNDEQQKQEVVVSQEGGVFLVFPCEDGATWAFTEAMLNEYMKVYPHVDAKAAARDALQWCRENPERLKPPSKMRRFIGGWFRDAAGKAQPPSPSNGKSGIEHSRYEKFESTVPLGVAHPDREEILERIREKKARKA